MNYPKQDKRYMLKFKFRHFDNILLKLKMKFLLKNLVLTIIIFTFFSITKTYSKNTKLNEESIYSNKIEWGSIEYKLPDGDWEFYHKLNYSIATIKLNCREFVLTENNNWKSFFEICQISNGGKYAHELSSILIQELKKGKYDSCQLRPEYYYAKLYTNGTTMNCFKIFHRDVNKELNFPDDPQAPNRGYIKKYFDKNNIILPKTALCSLSLFYAPSIRDKGTEVIHCINPEMYGAPKILSSSEENSEYHKDNIVNFPIQKKFYDNWMAIKAVDHKKLEENLKAKPHQIINLDDISTNTDINNNEILTNLKSLDELYKSGSLTKEEFEKAKKKILN